MTRSPIADTEPLGVAADLLSMSCVVIPCTGKGSYKVTHITMDGLRSLEFGMFITELAVTPGSCLEAAVVVDHLGDQCGHIGMCGAHALDMDTNLGQYGRLFACLSYPCSNGTYDRVGVVVHLQSDLFRLLDSLLITPVRFRNGDVIHAPRKQEAQCQ